MPELDELREELQGWPLRWRWEGSTGHPRRMVDALTQQLQELGYSVTVAEGEMRSTPLGNVGEFEGALIARAYQSRKEALKQKWPYALFGVILLPVLIGIPLLRYALDPLRYQIGLSWRGEAYPAGARLEVQQYGMERTTIVSEVRLACHATALEGDEVRPEDVTMQHHAVALKEHIDSALPPLVAPRSTREALPEGSDTWPAIEAEDARGRLEPPDTEGRQLPPPSDEEPP